MADKTDLTLLIQKASQGDGDAQSQAAEEVYEELRRTANWLMRNEKQQSLAPTQLVHDVLIKLLGNEDLQHLPNRRYFFAAAAKAMRRLLVDEARKRNALKRGGGMERNAFSETVDRYESNQIDLVELSDALQRLEQMHPRQAEVVHLKFFVQASMNEIASLLDVSLSTAESDWRTAKAFLFSHFSDSNESSAPS